MKLKINVIIFDFDGVIVDSGSDIANAVNVTLKHFERPLLSKEEIISYIGHGAIDLIRASFKGCDEEMVQKALPYYKSYYLEHCIVETKLYNNLIETLEFFTDKKMAVVTNKAEAMTNKILEGLGISKYFKAVIGPESVKELKPNPEGLNKVLELLNEKPENAIMVGDSYTDTEVGRNAGTYTCGAMYGLGDRKRLVDSSPDFLIGGINELTGLID